MSTKISIEYNNNTTPNNQIIELFTNYLQSIIYKKIFESFICVPNSGKKYLIPMGVCSKLLKLLINYNMSPWNMINHKIKSKQNRDYILIFINNINQQNKTKLNKYYQEKTHLNVNVNYNSYSFNNIQWNHHQTSSLYGICHIYGSLKLPISTMTK